MKRLDRAITIAALLAFVPLGAAMAQSFPDPFHVVDHWAQLPAGRSFGKVIGVQVDPDGMSIWAFDRCGAGACTGSPLAPIFEFDASGKMVKNFGAGLFIQPHGFTIDRAGHLWTTDADAKDGSKTYFIPAVTQVSIPPNCPEPGTGAEGVAADAAGNVFGGETACGRTLRKCAKE